LLTELINCGEGLMKLSVKTDIKVELSEEEEEYVWSC
jgi:hypothetical protein